MALTFCAKEVAEHTERDRDGKKRRGYNTCIGRLNTTAKTQAVERWHPGHWRTQDDHPMQRAETKSEGWKEHWQVDRERQEQSQAMEESVLHTGQQENNGSFNGQDVTGAAESYNMTTDVGTDAFRCVFHIQLTSCSIVSFFCCSNLRTATD